MLKILIADDEVIERTVLERKLKKYYGDSCAVLTARNGREALELFAAHYPRIVILDIEMPGVNGLEAAKEIRKSDRSCSIIFLTAFDEFSYAKAAISVHALDYLLKPCDDSELISAVDEAIRLSLGLSDQGGVRSGTAAPSSSRQAAAGKPDSMPESENLQAEILSYIDRRYMEDLSVQEISGHFGYSEAYFCKLFKQYFGHSFVTYLTDLRMKKAEDLMRTSSLSIKKIGRIVGYPDPNYFTKVFRRVRGVSPSEFREAGEAGAPNGG